MDSTHINDLVKRANITLKQARSVNEDAEPDKQDLILEKLIELNEQLVKALEKEIKVNNQIEVKPAKVEAPKIEIKPLYHF